MARVVLITGGAGGMGRSIAARFLADGDTVMLADRTDEALAEAAARLGEVETVTADVTVVDDCERMVAGTVERLGGIDVMVVKNPFEMGKQSVRLIKAMIEDDKKIVGEMSARFCTVCSISPGTGLPASM